MLLSMDIIQEKEGEPYGSPLKKFDRVSQRPNRLKFYTQLFDKGMGAVPRLPRDVEGKPLVFPQRILATFPSSPASSGGLGTPSDISSSVEGPNFIVVGATGFEPVTSSL